MVILAKRLRWARFWATMRLQPDLSVNPEHLGRRVMKAKALWVSLLGVAMCAVSGCTATSSRTPAEETSQSAATIHGPAVIADKTTTVDLGGGAHLIIPPGAMEEGAVVTARRAGAPTGKYMSTAPAGDPIELVSSPPNAIHGLLTLEFPLPVSKGGQAGVISTLDDSTGVWTPWPTTYDSARQMMVAQIPHFSWWNPTTWDWARIGARVNQDVGEVLGRRASAPACDGSGAPDWVNAATFAGISSDAALAVRSCFQSQGNVLDVQITNNRPYGVVLTYGAPVKWGWHEPGSSALEMTRNRLLDTLMSPTELYIPPLSRASVGVLPTPAGSHSAWRIGMTRESVVGEAVDLVSDLVGDLPKLDCATYLLGAPISEESKSPSAMRDLLVDAGGCLKESMLNRVASGQEDTAKVTQLAARLDALKKASLVGRMWKVYGYEWKIADIFVDQVWVGSGSLGGGFSFNAKSGPAAVAPPTPVAPPPAAAPQPPAAAQPAPQPPPGPDPVPQPSAPPAPTTYTEQSGSRGSPTFREVANASGPGPQISAMSFVQVSCKVRPPSTIASAQPDGYWYRIASAPWNDQYYAVANTFWNGDTPGRTPYIHNTDFSVPDC